MAFVREGKTKYGRDIKLSSCGVDDIIVETVASREAPYNDVARKILVTGATADEEKIGEAVWSVLVEDAFLNLPSLTELAKALHGMGHSVTHCGYTAGLIDDLQPDDND